MNKAFSNFQWENDPSVNTPLSAENLNKVNNALNEVDNRVVSHDTTKANQTEMLTAFTDVTLDEKTGKFTFTRHNGTKVVLDTKLEKLILNWRFDSTAQILYLILEDGSEMPINLSAFITNYEFVDSTTIRAVIGTDDKVAFEIIDGTITGSKLEPNYLANIQVEATKASASATSAELSAQNAESSAVRAEKAAEDAQAAVGGDFATNSRVDDIVSGATMVGNAEKLDGHDSDYFASKSDLDARIAPYYDELLGEVYKVPNWLEVTDVLVIRGSMDENDYQTNPSILFINHDMSAMYSMVIVDGKVLVLDELQGAEAELLSSINFTEIVTPSAIGAASTADLANYLQKTGGDVNGSVNIKSNSAETRWMQVSNSIRSVENQITASGRFVLYDNTNKKEIITSALDGTNTFNGTASGNLPLTGGTIHGAVTIENPSGGQTATLHMRNAVRHMYWQTLADGRYVLIDNTNGGIKMEFSADGKTNTFNGTASGNLSLSGGRLSKNKIVALEIENTATNASVIDFYGADGRMGALGFNGKNVPIYQPSEGGAHTLHHDGNSSKVVVATSAPSDTKSVWIDATNQKIKAYISGAWTVV